ncbi:MAG: hypothetical protein H0X38_05430 [Planctomycetes bacterium]|nr:hypothetical protein [Planctomycetota bacterium]
MTPICRSPRTGAALIIALVILAALMLLGLPFIFSQSGALAGTRSFARGQTAQVGLGAAENSGIGLAGNAAARHLLPGASVGRATDQEWSRIDWDLDIGYAGGNDTGTVLPARWAYADGRRYLIDWLSTPLASAAPPSDQLRRDLLGLTIEDEAGKLDPNHLDAAGWQRLLATPDVSITDDPPLIGHEPYGPLVEALANRRFELPGRRITDLNQLLTAMTPSGGRQHLTKAELAHLRPHLSLSNLAQARAGLIDLGTVVLADSPPMTTTFVPYLDSIPPAKLLAFPVTPDLIGAGTVLVSQLGTAPAQASRLASGDLSSNTTVLAPASPTAPSTAILTPLVVDAALAIEAPPAVNIHEAANTTLAALRVTPPPRPAPATPLPAMAVDTIGKLHTVNALADARQSTGPQLTAFDLLDPLAAYDEVTQGSVGATQSGDGASPISDLDGTPLVVQGAVILHVQGADFSRLPRTGYARIHGTYGGTGLPAIGGSPPVPPVIGPDEFISYTLSPTTAPATALFDVVAVSLRPGVATVLANFRAPTTDLPTITFIVPHEQAPITIASPGVVTIDSSAAVTDAQGRPDARRGRRVIAQTVPQEAPLETRWTTQSQIQALLASRQGSLMTSFPVPVQRVTDLTTSDVSIAPTGELQTGVGPPVVGEDQLTGLKPAILPAPHGSQLDLAWSRTFAGTSGSTSVTYLWQNGISSGPPAKNPLRTLDQVLSPEGVRMGIGDSVLAYPNPLGSNGFIPFGNEPSSGAVSTVAPFHFAIWIKPTIPLSGVVTVFDLRMPAVNAGVPLFGTPVTGFSSPPSIDVQNRVSLRYLVDLKQFSLLVNNGAIEHATDHGPKILADDFTEPYFDPQSGPTSASVDAQPLAPGRGNQTIKLRYAMGANGLQPNVWHLVQGVICGNMPGGMALMVDGVVGREAILESPVDLVAMGDHITLPSMRLLTALPLKTTADVQANAKNALLVGDIELDACTSSLTVGGLDHGGSAVHDLLPARGMIRIGQEFISYSGMTVAADRATLHHCMRARRQNTDGDGMGGNPATDPWPVTQAHTVGDLVVPGGYRISPPVGNRNLYRGGCALTAGTIAKNSSETPVPFPQGISTANYQMKALVSGLDNDVIVSVQPPASILVVTGPQLAFWPSRGVILVDPTGSPQYLFYNALTLSSATSGVFSGLHRLAIAGTPAGTPVQSFTLSSDDARTVLLVSLEVTSDPTEAGRYKPNGECLFQLYDPAGDGRAEWVTYTDTVFITPDLLDPSLPAPATGVGFFIDRLNGFSYDVATAQLNPTSATFSRGRERTRNPFSPQQPLPTDFAAGTLVLPVQTEINTAGSLITTGDILTIAPRQPTPTDKPLQVCVRYAPADGFSNAPDSVVDAHNHYFALTTALPDGTTWNCNVPATAFDLLCWPCWNSELDLSPYQPVGGDNTLLPLTQMPWAKSLQTGFGATVPSDARVYFGVLDDRAYPNDAQFPGLIDMPQSGPMPPMRMLTSTSVLGTTWLAKTDGISQLNGIKINYPNATFPQLNGLVMIGDEVFAFERIDNPPVVLPPATQDAPKATAKLIGRSLLGTKAVDHTLYEKMVFLPIGPVTELTTPLPIGATGHVSFISGTRIDAPAYLICSPDGQDMELVSLPQMVTAPWLRGMYGTMPRNWPTSAGTPLVIAWWPRYPSAFPHTTGLTALGLLADQKSSLLRCRSYAWASFPVRFHDTYFVDADPVTIDFPPRDSNVKISYAAMSNGMDWDFSMFKDPYAGTPITNATPVPSGQLFSAAPFSSGGHPSPVDGAEIRVIWQYATPPYNGPPDAVAFLTQAAANANQAPMIGSAKIVVRAPSKILAVVPP